MRNCRMAAQIKKDMKGKKDMKEKEVKPAVITFRTTPAVVEALEQQAAIRGWSVSQMVAWIVSESLFSLR